ncbi:hypothetical protein ACEV6G_08110 [Enterobacter ludwigii]|uniref:hypothetical protein n=1 Tax=Enterobacter ludwigii TaxID=299767 RepID=UPI003BEEDFC0
MSNIDIRALREAAEKASTDNHTQDEWFHYLRCSTPETVLALLDELEAKDKLNAELMEKQRLIDICQGQGLEHRIAADKRAEAAESRIAELSHHLQSAHAFIEHTEVFGYEASNGILCCGDVQWNIDESKSALAAAGKGE